MVRSVRRVLPRLVRRTARNGAAEVAAGSRGLASTFRLFCLARAAPGRLISLASDLRPGDVVSVGRPGKAKWGEHIVICTERPTPFDEASTFATVEGNATGGGSGRSALRGRCPPVAPGHAVVLGQGVHFRIPPTAGRLHRRAP